MRAFCPALIFSEKDTSESDEVSLVCRGTIVDTYMIRAEGDQCDGVVVLQSLEVVDRTVERCRTFRHPHTPLAFDACGTGSKNRLPS